MLSGTQQGLYIGLLILTWIVLIGSIALTSLANIGPEQSGGMLSSESYYATIMIYGEGRLQNGKIAGPKLFAPLTTG